MVHNLSFMMLVFLFDGRRCFGPIAFYYQLCFAFVSHMNLGFLLSQCFISVSCWRRTYVRLIFSATSGHGKMYPLGLLHFSQQSLNLSKQTSTEIFIIIFAHNNLISVQFLMAS